ncbi:thiamine pyrophosphate-binding protein [Massilia sp. W12]|uniref:thiamine pyrophosphate-binding protein n=1 Tax=Massilia sp. W12 TaxID=3126507 RepID=UPI0030CF78C1
MQQHPPQTEHGLDVADLLVAYLEQLGVRYVFGVPGGVIEPLYNAMARSSQRGGVRHVLARHETGAAFMADGYARDTMGLGVCCSTSGPGATNLLTGVASAYDNNIPLLVLTGQPALPTFGKHPLQESACTGVNILTMFQACTRYNSLLSHPAQLEPKLVSALQRALANPRGPVHLSLPSDVMRSKTGLSKPSFDLRRLLQQPDALDEAAIQDLRSILAKAANVVLLIGGGCTEAMQPILQFVEMTGAQIIATPDGKGLINPCHRQFRGVFGFAGHNLASATLRDPSVDVIIAVGTGMCEWDTDGWSDSLLNARMIHVEEIEEHFARTPMARLHIRGRILAIFKRLIEFTYSTPHLRSQQAHDAKSDGEHFRPLQATEAIIQSNLARYPRKYHLDQTPILPQRLMHDLGRLFPYGARFFADAGNSVAWAIHCLHPHDRRLRERRLQTERAGVGGRRKADAGWLRLTHSFAPMGWAIGAAIGAAMADRSQVVICISGDGSMLMNGQEVTVAVAERLNVVFVVLNDHALGMVKHAQRLRRAEQTAFALPVVDFAMQARAYGAQGITIRSPQDMARLDIEAICTRDGPTVLDVWIDTEEVPPIQGRIRVLESNDAPSCMN